MSSAWVTRLECPKGVKDEVKQARRAKRVAEGHQLEIGAQRAPRFLVCYNFEKHGIQGYQISNMFLRLVLRPINCGYFATSSDPVSFSILIWQPFSQSGPSQPISQCKSSILLMPRLGPIYIPSISLNFSPPVRFYA